MPRQDRKERKDFNADDFVCLKMNQFLKKLKTFIDTNCYDWGKTPEPEANDGEENKQPESTKSRNDDKEWETIGEYAKVNLKDQNLIECNKITEIHFSRRLTSLKDTEKLTDKGLEAIEATAKFLYETSIQFSKDAVKKLSNFIALFDEGKLPSLQKLVAKDPVDIKVREDTGHKKKNKRNDRDNQKEEEKVWTVDDSDAFGFLDIIKGMKSTLSKKNIEMFVEYLLHALDGFPYGSKIVQSRIISIIETASKKLGKLCFLNP
ncbi:unnamed protein product [Moneuplotes crassus]|uniref:Uncharacterized protein n=1 Tax=Euplotes crassus TaxID=5936 RepID=A0AAD1Y4I1_EUPCR|nr:unnamed protein product [Moneuplotes crassus]